MQVAKPPALESRVGVMSITTYDDLTLIDPRPVALDDELRQLCARFRSRPAGLRNTLTTNDFYVLLAFARRAAVFAIRERDAAWIADGLTAVAIVDDERIDARELAPTLGLLHHAAVRIGADAGALFADAARHATRSVARAFRQPAFSGFEEIATGFVGRDANEYHPRHDLLQTALAIRALLERERYRVEEVTLATSLPEVWFEAPPRAAGVVTIHARHREDPEQLLIAFIAEVIGGARCAPLPGDVAAVVVTHEDLLCLLIARVETTVSLQRFIEPVRHALVSARGSDPCGDRH